jgi:hypothetical protein
MRASGCLGFICVNLVYWVLAAIGKDVKEHCQVEGVMIPTIPEDRGI